MNCQDFENKISGYMDGELSSDEMKLFEEHIASCRQCSDLLSELQSVDEMLAGMEPPLPDEAYWSGFDARLREKVDKAAEKRPWWNFYPLIRRQLGWAVAAIVLVMIFVFPILRETMFPRATEPASQKTMAPATTQNIEEKESAETAEKKASYEATPSLPMEAEAPEKKWVGEAPASSAVPTADGLTTGSNEAKPDADMIASAPPKSESLTAAPRMAAKPAKVADLKSDDRDIRKPEAVVSGEMTAPPAITDVRRMEAKTSDREVGYSRHYASKSKANAGNFGGNKTERNSMKTGKEQPEAPRATQPGPHDETAKGRADNYDGKSTLADKVPALPPPAIPGSELDASRVPSGEAAPKPRYHEEAPADAPDMSPSEGEDEGSSSRAPAPFSMAESAKSAKMRAGVETKDAPMVKTESAPAQPAGTALRDRTLIRRSMSEVNDYLATSEVVLIKIVSMPDNGVNLRNLQKQLTLSNYIEDLNRNVGKFKTDPVLEKHSREMQVITNEIMTVNPKGLSGLKRRVINSGIIDKTRELKK